MIKRKVSSTAHSYKHTRTINSRKKYIIIKRGIKCVFKYLVLWLSSILLLLCCVFYPWCMCDMINGRKKGCLFIFFVCLMQIHIIITNITCALNGCYFGPLVSFRRRRDVYQKFRSGCVLMWWNEREREKALKKMKYVLFFTRMGMMMKITMLRSVIRGQQKIMNGLCLSYTHATTNLA